MDDIARLQIRVESLEAEVAGRRLNNLSRSARKTEKATAGMTKSFVLLAAKLAIVTAGIASITKLISVTREFDVLNTQLVTATGSAENAKIAFAAIQDFAAETPYDLQQVTAAFISLVNRGFTPSIEAMTAYGDMASATGFELSQMILAIGGAVTGEYEALKKFGVTTKKQGDQVTFTFRGISETVGNTTKEIEQYFQRLSNQNFAGGMKRLSETLHGLFSNIGDEWDKLWLNISQQGPGDLFYQMGEEVLAGLEYLNEVISSGAVTQEFELWGDRLQWVGERAEDTYSILAGIFNDITADVEDTADSSENAMDGFFDYLPEKAEMVIDQMTAIFQGFVDTAVLVAQDIKSAFIIELDALLDYASAFGRAFMSNLNPFARDLSIYELLGEAYDKAGKSHVARITTFDETLAGIESRTDAAVLKSAEKFEADKEWIEAVRAFNQEIRDEESADRDAARRERADAMRGFYRGAEGRSGSAGGSAGKAAKKTSDAKEKARKRDFERLVDYLRTEEEALQASYEKRKQIILDNTKEGSEQQIDLMKRLNDKYTEELEGLTTSWEDIWDSAIDSFAAGFARGIIDQIDNANASFSDFVKSFVKGIAQMALEMQIKKLLLSFDFFGGASGGVISGGAVKPIAMGAVVDNSNILPFASGGIVNSPTLFPLNSGIGLMGEAGAEAIVPLERHKGKLGVGASPVNINTTIHNNANVKVSEKTSRDQNGTINQDFFIEVIEGAVASGKLDNTMATNYGMQRRGY